MNLLSAFLIFGFALTTFAPSRAAKPRKPASTVTTASLLDQAIRWPGDFVRGDESCPFEEPPFPAYGTVARQEYFLSKDRIAELNQNHAAIAAELLKRLKAFGWKDFPPAPKPGPQVEEQSKRELGKLPADSTAPGPWKPENPLALGATMLRIIETTDAVETLPELLRLEGELNDLNEAAIRARLDSKGFSNRPLGPLPGLYVPPIEAGRAPYATDFASTGKKPEIAALYAPGKPGEKLREAWFRWESQVFANLLFQREMLGVSLGLLERKEYGPLPHSSIGRLVASERKRAGEALMNNTGIRSEADLTAEQREQGLFWDAELGVPRHGGAITGIPWSKAAREEARRLIQDFIRSGRSQAVTGILDGASLLEEVIAEPGSFNQMCRRPDPVSPGVPMPVRANLVDRYFYLGEKNAARLYTNRALVIPVLSERLGAMRMETSPQRKADGENSWSDTRSGQDSRTFGPLMLQVVDCLKAVECLPGLLQLEQQLSDIIDRADADASAPLPTLIMDAPSPSMIMAFWTKVLAEMNGKSDPSDPAAAVADKDSPGALKTRAREDALLVCQIYQRELLGLIKTLLEEVDYRPMKSSAFVRAQQAESWRQLVLTMLGCGPRDFFGIPLPANARAKDGFLTPVEIPYTTAIRAEIRSLAGAFLKETLPAKR
ncbi:MAG: hypothetical protein V4726_17460 [Verrucomicrobiota bacterium]